MSPSVRLGRLAGVEVGANWTWLIVVVLIASSLAGTVFPVTAPGLTAGAYIGMALVAVVVFFACLLLHELGHAIQARREGMTIDGITLWLFGGVARFRGSFPSAGAEFRIAIAGPLVTLALAALLLTASLAAPVATAVDAVVSWLASVNLLLLGFNLLPALPLDGGRVLRAALWRFKRDYVAATRTAAAISRVLALLFIAVGLVLTFFTAGFGGLWLAIIGWFLFLAAGAEAQAAMIHLALAGLRVRDAMVSAPVTVEAALPLEWFVAGVFPAHPHAAYPVVHHGSPVGVVDSRDAGALPRAARTDLVVGDRMIALAAVPTVKPDDPLDEAFMAIVPSSLQRALVLDQGRLAGLLSATDVRGLIDASGTRGQAGRSSIRPTPRNHAAFTARAQT